MNTFKFKNKIYKKQIATSKYGCKSCAFEANFSVCTDFVHSIAKAANMNSRLRADVCKTIFWKHITIDKIFENL